MSQRAGTCAGQHLLVKTGELAAELAQDRPPVLLDVRWRLAGPPGIDSYRQGHLPGAVFADFVPGSLRPWPTSRLSSTVPTFSLNNAGYGNAKLAITEPGQTAAFSFVAP